MIKYDKKIIFIEQVISKVLRQLNQPSLFNNQNFKLVKGSYHDEYDIVLSLIKKDSPELTFWLDRSGMRLDIDNVLEAFCVDDNYIEKHEKAVLDYLTMVFTSTIKVEHCGKHYTKLTFTGDNGEILDTFSYRDAIFAFRSNCQEKAYSPIYRV